MNEAGKQVLTPELKSSLPARTGSLAGLMGCQSTRTHEPCPRCETGRMDYDGLLDLVCLVCGYQAPGGGFT